MAKKPYTLTVTQAAALAKQLAPKLRGGEVLALMGPLGAGKTTFTKLLAAEFKIKRGVTSPTFTILHEHAGKLKSGEKIKLLHLDLYRTKNFREVKALGLTELWRQPNIITVVEWADKIRRHLPKKTIIINFKSLL